MLYPSLSVAPCATAYGVSPDLLWTSRIPALTLTVPVIVLSPLRVNCPAPVLLNPCVPATTALMMLVALLTAIPGVPLPTASVNGPPVPVLSVQLCFATPFKSSNTSVPMLRPPSSVTVALAFRLRVLKSATASTPPAMNPPLQLIPVVQDPPPAFVQTPDPAGTLMIRMAGALVTPLATTV